MKKLNLTDKRNPDYFYSEAIKTLRTNIQLSGQSIKTILVTSCYPNEGKSDALCNPYLVHMHTLILKPEFYFLPFSSFPHNCIAFFKHFINTFINCSFCSINKHCFGIINESFIQFSLLFINFINCDFMFSIQQFLTITS